MTYAYAHRANSNRCVIQARHVESFIGGIPLQARKGDEIMFSSSIFYTSADPHNSFQYIRDIHHDQDHY